MRRINGRLMLLQAFSQLRVASRRSGRRLSVCISKGGKSFFIRYIYICMVLRISGGIGLRHFHTFLCNVGSSRVSITRGLACTFWRSILVNTILSLFISYPKREPPKMRFSLFLAFEIPPIDCAHICLEERRRARLLHS